MNFYEKQVKEAVVRRFGIDETQDFEFETHFKEIEDTFIKENFDEDKIHRVWIGRIKQNESVKYFVMTLEGLPEEISKGTFENCQKCNDVWNFMHVDGKLYNFIYCSDGQKAIVPGWWLDVSRVMGYVHLPPNTEWAFEYRGDGKKSFFAWVFYPLNTSPKIFNIEEGAWHTEETAFVKVPIKAGNCRIRTMQLFCEQGILRRSMLLD